MDASIEIKELPEIKLIGITHIGEFEKTPEVYAQLLKWANENITLDPSKTKLLTIYHDNPRITHMSKVRWSACIIIEKEITADGEIRQISISKGRYAIGHFEIEPIQFEQAWASVLSWVKQNEYQFGDHDYFELYHNDNRTHPEHKFIVDICVPIKEQ